MIDHELRLVLNDELHGRPGMAVTAPCRITHLAFTVDDGGGEPLNAITRLCDALGVKPPQTGAVHHTAELHGGSLKYEQHGEFYRISIIADGESGKGEAIALLPLGWLDTLPGKRLVAIHTHILAQSAPAPTPQSLTALFHDGEVAGSLVTRGGATVYTDFRIGDDGYTRMLVHDHGVQPLRLGRVARRIHEIETYRMMALLAFPLARQLQKELGPLEKALAQTIDGMLAAQAPDEDARLLGELSHIARDVEEMSNRASYRFAAARAYAALVAKRVAELGEDRVANCQRLGVFLDRRFSPAMTTCQAVGERISGLAARTERASNLLRTRVDIALEAQNQRLLRSMESRSRQQVMLQETVEGLSVVAISYYSIAIVSKVFEALGPYVPALESKAAMLVAIPVILGLVWLGLRRIHARVQRAVQRG